MRLRLSVQRNNLPATNILWSIPDTNSPQAYTIARLLEDVSRVLPLEAEQWGLEDYTVEVDGFECLHFSPVSQTLKEDDHVSIRPLLTAEVRSRTLCGRYQISEGGQHLVDGIPFGRPYLRQPNRPAVRIPPRKRRRLEEDTIAGLQENDIVGLITANGETSPQLDGSLLTSYVADPVRNKQSRSRKDERIVHFMEADSDGLDDSEDDEEFAPSEEDDVSMDDSSDTSSEASYTASDSSSEVSDSSDTDSDTSSDTSSSASEAESVSSVSDVVTVEPIIPPKQPVPPGKGSKDTKHRNRRRQQSDKLKRLKQAGKLDENATLEDLRTYLSTPKEDSLVPVEHTPAKIMAAPTGKRKRLDEHPTTETGPDESAELERRKAELMAKFGEETSKDETPAHTAPPKDQTSYNEPPEKRTSKSNDTIGRPTKRLRPDTAAIGRMLARQTRAVEKKSSEAKPPTAAQEPPQPEGADDPDFWKSRINLSAFECWDEDHELSAPPFPFKQHWDPASKLMRGNANNKKRNKSRKSRTSVVTDEDEDTLVLDYDDSPDITKQDSDPTAAIESQLMQDVQVAAKSDLPPLPDDVESLPTLEPADIKAGAIIAFKLWVIDPKTVTPQFSNYKTAIVEKEGDSGGGAGTFRLTLAERDVPKPANEDEKGDKAGNTKDDSEMDEDKQDNNIWEGTFTELVTPKLLKAAE